MEGIHDEHNVVNAFNPLNHHAASCIPGNRMATDTFKGIKSLNAWQWEPRRYV